jgi:hypothetical protein
MEAAILRIQVQIDLAATRRRHGGHRSGIRPVRFIAEPPNDRTQVECVELPLGLRPVLHERRAHSFPLGRLAGTHPGSLE